MAVTPKKISVQFPRGEHPGHESDKVELTGSQYKALGIDSLMLMPDGTPACGQFACAYDTKDPNWVVKLTSDEDDADALQRAKGSEFVVPTKGVYELTRLRDPVYQMPMFGIVVERVTPIVGKESLFINEVLWGAGLTGLVKAGLFSGYTEGQKFVVERRVRDSIEPKCRSLVQTMRNRKDPRFVNENVETEACRLLINQTVDAIEDLADRGIQFVDNHAGNWGRRKNGRLVAIDLGLSSPPWRRQKTQIPMLSGFKDPVKGEFLDAPGKGSKRVWPPWGR